MRASQERNGVWLGLGGLNTIVVPVLVAHISVQNEGCCIQWCLECALGCTHGTAHLRLVENTHGLDIFFGNRSYWSILTEKLRVCHRWVVERSVVIEWLVEIFSCWSVSKVVVFWTLHVEVRNPTQLTIDVSVFWSFGVVWHSGSFELVKLVGIKFSFWFNQFLLGLSVVLVEKLFVVSMKFVVPFGRHGLMLIVPLVIIGSQHAIISVLVDNKPGSNLWTNSIFAHSSMCFENISQSFASEWWLSIDTGNWRS